MPLLPATQDYVNGNFLALDKITFDQRRALSSIPIQQFIEKGQLTVEQALALNYHQVRALDSKFIQQSIANGQLTFEQALALVDEERFVLDCKSIQQLITNGQLTFQQALALTLVQSDILDSESIQQFIANGRLTFQQALALTIDQHRVLDSEPIRQLITSGQLTIKQALTIDQYQYRVLDSKPIQQLITNGQLTIEQALELTLAGRYVLESEPIWEFITNGQLTSKQALALTLEQRKALNDADTQQRLRNGELTIQNILGHQILQEEQNIPTPVNINSIQSTHTASVHRTVSESAIRLLHRYPEIRNPGELEETIISLAEAINALPGGNQKNEAAKRCIKRLAAPDYVYTDPTSGVNVRELLALSWLAVNDEKARTGSLADAKNQFTEGLYEIQRGYSLSETGVDLHGPDVFICLGGTFNKLLEKLQGVHPDITINFITHELAALKLPIIVKEEVINYLSARAKPSTVSELTQFTQQIKQIEEKGVEVIWDAVKDKVAVRMFDEFSSLSANQNVPRFAELIDVGKDSEWVGLPSFQKEISESEGYRKYCSTVMKSSHRIFFQAQAKNTGNDLSNEDTNTPKL